MGVRSTFTMASHFLIRTIGHCSCHDMSSQSKGLQSCGVLLSATRTVTKLVGSHYRFKKPFASSVNPSLAQLRSLFTSISSKRARWCVAQMSQAKLKLIASTVGRQCFWQEQRARRQS